MYNDNCIEYYCSSEYSVTKPTKDALMSVSRIAVAVLLLTSYPYPLAFTGGCSRWSFGFGGRIRAGNETECHLSQCSDGRPSLHHYRSGLPVRRARFATLILSFGGATWGNAVIYLFPTYYVQYMFVQCAKKMPELRKEVPLATATGIVGLLMGIVGATKAIYCSAPSIPSLFSKLYYQK
jgi:hypothetical protein